MDVLDQLRADEFSRLGPGSAAGTIYLDHAGAALYSERALLETTHDLLTAVLGNPHSGRGGKGDAASHPDSAALPAVASHGLVAAQRRRVLRHFGADPSEYCVVFTAGATAALKLVGEGFPFADGATLRYANSCHNSVAGLREFAARGGAACEAVEIGTDGSTAALFPEVDAGEGGGEEEEDSTSSYTLIVCPAECNWSGTKCDLTRVVRTGPTTYVLIDASKFLQNDTLSLGDGPGQCPADFVVCSFYKMFGFPTGIGALVARRDAARLLLRHRTYFGGGTVLDAGRTGPGSHRRKDVPDGLEDGTVNFLAMVGLKRGFEFFDRLPGGNLVVAQARAFALAQRLYWGLKALVHKKSGEPVCLLYSCTHEAKDPRRQGPVVTFNVCFPSGKPVGHSIVASALSRHRIQVRSGCFCSPGACTTFMPHMTVEEAEAQYTQHGHECGGNMDLTPEGKPTGAVRVSVGWMNTEQDIDAVLAVVRQNYMGVEGCAAWVLAETQGKIAPATSGMGTMLRRAADALADVARASAPELTVGSWVGTVFDSAVAKIARVYPDGSFNLAFDDGTEMPGVTRDQLVLLEERRREGGGQQQRPLVDTGMEAAKETSVAAGLDPERIMALLQSSVADLEQMQVAATTFDA